MRFAHFIQSLASWLVATLFVCCVLGFVYYYHRGDEELRRYLEQHLAAKYPSHSIKIGSARIIAGEGIRLREVSLVEPRERHELSHGELAYCDEVVLYCNPQLQELIHGQVKIKRVLLRQLLVKPTRDPSGRWNFSTLLDGSSGVDILPTVEIEDAQLELKDYFGPQPNQISLHQIQASVAPDPEGSGQIRVNAALGSEHFQAANIEAFLDPRRPGSWYGSGSIENLNCNRGIRQVFAQQHQDVPPLLDGLHALAQVRFSFAKAATESIPRFDIEAQIENGKYEAPRFLAHTISDISIPLVKLVNKGHERYWSIQDATANFGTSKIRLFLATGPSFQLGSDVDLDVAVDDLNLTRELITILPSKQQALWAKYRPLGRMDIHAKSVRRGGRWLTNANATCEDISIECERFRYPLTRCYGNVRFREHQDLFVDLWAAPDRSWKENPIHIVANINRPGPDFTGAIEVRMRQDAWLPIDARLHAATGPTVRGVLEDLSARGELNFRSVLRRDSLAQKELSKDTVIFVRKGGLKYDRFPYPLQDVTGKLHVTDSEFRFEDIEGFNDSCVVTCEGTWHVQGPDSGLLQLNLAARDIPCDTELRKALPAGPREIWRDLRPAGTIDHASIDIKHQTGMSRPKIGVVVTQLRRDDEPDGRSLEMKPSWFPLSMERVTGSFKFSPNGVFSLKDIQAEHGTLQRRVMLRSQGRGIFREDGSWEIMLDRVIADRIETTPEFIAALPKNLSDAMRSLEFQGTLFVDAKDVRFAAEPDPLRPIRASWQSTINIDNGRFTLAGQPVTNLFGEVKVFGSRQTQWVSYGRANFDTLTCNDVHLENVDAPWYMDDRRFVFGEAVRVNGKKTRNATGELFGGLVEGTGQVAFTDAMEFGMNLELNNFDVGHSDLQAPSEISGIGTASLSLQGNAQGYHTLRGNGGIQLRDANLAKLPAIIQLLNTMRINRRRPDVFTDADVSFRIDGPTAYFDHFDLHGESLSLKGQGRMELDRRVFLKFYSLLGGERMYFEWMRPFAKETSERLLQIFVTGTLDDPKVSQEMGPGWKELFPSQAGAYSVRVTESR